MRLISLAGILEIFSCFFLRFHCLKDKNSHFFHKNSQCLLKTQGYFCKNSRKRRKNSIFREFGPSPYSEKCPKNKPDYNMPLHTWKYVSLAMQAMAAMQKPDMWKNEVVEKQLVPGETVEASQVRVLFSAAWWDMQIPSDRLFLFFGPLFRMRANLLKIIK